MPGRFTYWVPFLALGLGTAHAAPVPYTLDQRYATIEFLTNGPVAADGYFKHFAGQLQLDFKMPGNSRVDVSVDDTAFSLSVPWGGDTLRSKDYFDSADFPTIAFHSVAITVQSPTNFQILGNLTIRGITKPLLMQAQLLSAPSAQRVSGTADFYVTGTLKCSDFGMVADQGVVGDEVQLKIHARVTLEKPAPP